MLLPQSIHVPHVPLTAIGGPYTFPRKGFRNRAIRLSIQ
jgi:hypothetical protein